MLRMAMKILMGLFAGLCFTLSVFPQTAPVHLQVTVTDSTGAFVRDLQPGDFVVSVGKTRFNVLAAKLATDSTPEDLALVIDTSMIAGQVANPLNDISQAFIEDLGPDNQIAIVAFDSSASLIQDFTSSKRLLADAVRGLRYGNGAALLDAIYATADGGYANSTARPLMVALSTGIDTGSRTKLKDLIPLLVKRKIAFYGISLGGRGFFGGGSSEVFDKLSAATGGRAFYPRKANDLAGIVNQILGTTGKREHYELTLASPPPNAEEAQQRLRVQIDRDQKEDKNLLVTARFVQKGS